MGDNRIKNDEISLIDVIIFIYKNKRFLLACFIIGCIISGSLFIYQSQLYKESKESIEIKYAQVKFQYHETYDEIKNKFKPIEGKIEEFYKDQQVLDKALKSVFNEKDFVNISSSDIEGIIMQLESEDILSIIYGQQVRDQSNKRYIFIRMKKIILPESVDFEKFADLFISAYYSELNRLIIDLLKKDALLCIENEYNFYRNLPEDIRIIELKNIQENVSYFRKYSNGSIEIFSDFGGLQYIKTDIERNIVPLYVYILILIFCTLIPIIIKTVFVELIHIKNLAKEKTIKMIKK